MSHPRFLSLAVPTALTAALLFAGGALAAGHGGGGGGHGGGGHAGGGHAGGVAHVGGVGHIGGVSHVGGVGGVGHVGGVSHVGFTHVGGVSHVGATHVGGVNHGNFNNFSHGNFRHDGHNHGFFPGVGVGLLLGSAWGGWPGYYDYGYGYGYGGAPYDYGYGAPTVVYNNYSLDYGAPAYGPPPAQMPPADGQPDNQATPQQQADPTAHIEVRVPDGAEVWFGTGKTKQTGARREFVSPPLTPGEDYSYEIRAKWVENGKEMEQTRRIDVRAGSWKGVDFTRPPVETVEPPKPSKP